MKARKMIVIEMPDRSKWAVAAEVVAHDRANHYRSDGYQEEFQYAMSDHSELLDWAANNMNWEDVRQFARPYQKPEEMGQDGFQEGWVNGEKEVTDVPCHMDLPVPECK